VKKFLATISFSIILFTSSAAMAREPATPEFTVQEAVEEALAHSANIKSDKYDVDRTYEIRQFASQNLEFVPEGPASSDVTRPYYALLQADTNWQMSEKSLELQIDKVEMEARKAYNAVLQGIEKEKASEAALRNAERQRTVAYAKLRVGIINKQDMLQAEASVTAAKAAYEENVKNLNDSYQKFNYLVGLYPEDRPVLTELPTFEKIKVDSLDYYIEKSLADNPSLWLAEKNVEIAKTSLKTYDFTSSTRTEPYKAKELEVNQAVTSAADGKEQARKALRSIYYSLTGLEEQYEPAVEQVKLDEENLRIIKVKYDVGMATIMDVTQAETDLAQAKQQLMDLICEHDSLKQTFTKPWADSAG